MAVRPFRMRGNRSTAQRPRPAQYGPARRSGAVRGRKRRGAALTYFACIDLFVCKHGVAVAAAALYIESRIRNRLVVLYIPTIFFSSMCCDLCVLL